MYRTGEDYDTEIKQAYSEDVYDLDAEARLSIEATPPKRYTKRMIATAIPSGYVRDNRPVMDIAGWN